MLTFEFTGVEGRMTESEILTSGMVGKTVRILFDDSWTDLTKTAVFRTDSICRIVPWDGSVMTIPEDVLLQPFRRLYVGVCGTDAAGTLVIPTIMAEGPMIRYGADPTEDSTADDLPAWKKLRDLIGDPSLLETEAKDNLVAAINEIHAELRPSGGTGLSQAAAQLLIEILRHAVYETGQSANIDDLEEELLGSETPDAPEKSLSYISVTYSGGSVPVGTSVNALTGITVTGHYSDGSTAPVTDYTLYGTIAFSGGNTVTVICGAFTAYFTVTGVAKTLTGITAVYSGGSVPVGTAVSALLTQVSVTAAYGDGSTAQVTGFTLSGQIANVGSNTVTVSYSGKTATFEVTGLENESSEPSQGQLLYSWDFSQSLVDMLRGQEVILTNATRDTAGLHIGAANAVACTNVDITGKTAEIEFGEVTDGIGGAHGRAVTLGHVLDPTSAGAYNSGLVWHNNGHWAWYGGATTAGWTDGTNTTKLAISNGTLRMPIKANKGKTDVTLNGEVLISNADRSVASYLSFGSYTTAFYHMTVKKLKIYEGA